ncbi:MAG: hypothetical protein E7536_03065 [Ruminococcaceae bacterium]|nr:hypothetical protein [Oscillospiraceae bacterium]
MNEELKIIISAQTAQAQKNIKEAKEEIEKLGEEGKKSSGKFKQAMEAIGNAAKTGLKAVGTAVKTAGAAMATGAAALTAVAESTREYRKDQALLASSFEASGKSAESAATTYNDLYRVLGDSGQATEAAQQLGKLGLKEAELQGLTYSLQGVYAQFGNSLPLEGLAEAVNHTAKVGEVQGSLADALEWSGINVEDFNGKLAACATEQERAQLIASTLSTEYDGAAASFEKTAKDVLDANEA